MTTTNPPDLDTTDTEKQGHRRSPLAGLVLLAVSAAAVFLLGCFVVGPWLSRRQPTIVTAGPAATPPDLRPPAAPGLPNVSPAPPPRAKITVEAEPLPEPPAAPPSVPETAPPSGTSPETVSPAPDRSPPTPARAGDEAASQPPLHHVQAGIFTHRARAEDLAGRLSAAGFVATVHHLERDGSTMYAVQAGAFANRDNADAQAEALRKAGFEATITTEDQR